jgi:hypothetical protein
MCRLPESSQNRLNNTKQYQIAVSDLREVSAPPRENRNPPCPSRISGMENHAMLNGHALNIQKRIRERILSVLVLLS